MPWYGYTSIQVFWGPLDMDPMKHAKPIECDEPMRIDELYNIYYKNSDTEIQAHVMIRHWRGKTDSTLPSPPVEWKVFRRGIPKTEIVFFSQVTILSIMILFSLINLSIVAEIRQ